MKGVLRARWGLVAGLLILLPAVARLPRRNSQRNLQQPGRSTTCCCGAGTSSMRATSSAPCATWRSPTARSPRSPRSINPADALKTVDVSGLYVTPGLIDIHAHIYAGTGERNSYAGDNSLYPDGFTFRVGVTTVADAGCAGWRNFEDFKQRVIDRSKTRILAFLNIVGNGMRGGKFEQDLADMEAQADGRHGEEVSGADRRHQDRALQRAGVGAGRACGRGRHAWPTFR